MENYESSVNCWFSLKAEFNYWYYCIFIIGAFKYLHYKLQSRITDPLITDHWYSLLYKCVV